MNRVEADAFALSLVYDAMSPRLIPSPPSPPSLAEQVATVVGVLRARRHECYGGWAGNDAQLDEAARAIVTALDLERHNQGE